MSQHLRRAWGIMMGVSFLPVPRMFQLYYDTDSESLADRLADHLAVPCQAADVLKPATVLVPQRGLERWLTQRLAVRHGIAANIEFLMPAQMVWQVLRQLHGSLPEQSHFDRDVLVWRIFALFGSAFADDERLRRMLPATRDDAVLLDVARHLAHLFERYQGYRRDLLLSWEAGDEPDDVQAMMWRKLVEDAPEKPRSHLLGDLLAGGRDQLAQLSDLPDELHVFGCIGVSPDVLRFLGLLGQVVDVHFYLPTPCREYWGDVPRRGDAETRARLLAAPDAWYGDGDNPFLVSLGGVGRDFIRQVFGYDEVQPDHEVHGSENDPPRDTLLHRVQADVITLQGAPADVPSAPDADDCSLRVHLCHSPLREVQVLHDTLLDLFERDPTLEPQDVAVMMTDVATYAPRIDAVFGALSPDDRRYIPWRVADRPVVQAHPLVAMFVSLLNLPASRLSLADVLEVAAVPAVARARGWQPDDIKRAGTQLEDAGVRWGMDGADREAAGLPPYDDFSWSFGRDRLMLGYLLGDVDEGLVDGIAPLGEADGHAASVLGQMFELHHDLHALRSRQLHDRLPSAWRELLQNAVDKLVPAMVDEGDERALEQIHDILDALVADADAAGFTGTVDWRGVRTLLSDALDRVSTHQSFLSGGVNVCGMVPLRNVPFRVICVLGLDGERFPRQERDDAISRMGMAGTRRLGDRSVREDDRYLFLQTIMAARDVLHLSCTGMDARDNHDIEPSTVLSELIDTVCTTYFSNHDAARQAVVIRHPLQPFSPAQFDGKNGSLFSYRAEWCPKPDGGVAAGPFADGPLAVDAEREERVALADLQSFFAAPQRQFLVRSARLALPEEAGTPEEHEPLGDEPLRRSMEIRCLFQGLVDAGAEGDSTVLRRTMRAEAWLPPLELGRDQFDKDLDSVQPQVRQWFALQGEAATSRPFEVRLPSGRVVGGTLEGVTPDGVLGAWVGKSTSIGPWMRLWLAALAGRAAGQVRQAMAFGGNDDEQAFPVMLVLPDANAAADMLDTFVALRDQGLREPLPIPLKAGWAFVCADPDVDDRKRAKAVKKALDEWDKTMQWDAWTVQALRGIELFPEGDIDPRFEELALEILKPLHDAMYQGEGA